MGRGAEWIGAWLWGRAGECDAGAVREARGGGSDGVCCRRACQVRDRGVGRDDLVARHEERSRGQFEHGRRRGRESVGGGYKGGGCTTRWAPHDPAECGQDRIACNFGIGAALENDGGGHVAGFFDA